MIPSVEFAYRGQPSADPFSRFPLPALQYHEYQVKMQHYLFHISLFGSKIYIAGLAD
jgi:hypothetical protein